MDCIFCKIISGEIPSDKVYEDADVLAFMDIRPVIRGHVLVVPKKHSQDVLEVEEADLHKTIVAARKISHAVMKAINTDAFTISTNRGEASGQSVFHLHFHIIPRFKKDGLTPWPHQETEPKTRKDMAKLIQENL
jgi:histidine triad (HIT) family protein